MNYLESKMTLALNLLYGAGPGEAWNKFIELCNTEPFDDPSVFNMAFRCVYPYSSLGKTKRNQIEIIAPRVNRDLASHPDALGIIDNLPNQITVYRGTCVAELESGNLGVSWSTDRGVAEYFAFYGYDDNDNDRIVISTHIDKDSVIAAFNAYDELEVLCLVEPGDANVLSRYPTEAMMAYMNRHHDNYMNLINEMNEA